MMAIVSKPITITMSITIILHNHSSHSEHQQWPQQQTQLPSFRNGGIHHSHNQGVHSHIHSEHQQRLQLLQRAQPPFFQSGGIHHSHNHGMGSDHSHRQGSGHSHNQGVHSHIHSGHQHWALPQLWAQLHSQLQMQNRQQGWQWLSLLLFE